MAGLYAADGSWNVTNVIGDVYTGLYAADGSINIISSSPGSGAYHACGALRTTSSGETILPRQAPDGSLYITDEGLNNGAQKVTILA